MDDNLRQWISTHDDKMLFTVLYIGLSVILSVAISIFWLLVVVLIHVVLEWLALNNKGEGFIFSKIFWHLKLDFGLVLFALCLGLYMDAAFGLVGLGSASRAGAQVSTRFILWQRAIRGVLLTIDDAAQVSKALLSKKTNPDDSSTQKLPWRNRWGVGDWISISLLGICVFFIALTPLFLDQSFSSVISVLAEEMHPWP